MNRGSRSATVAAGCLAIIWLLSATAGPLVSRVRAQEPGEGADEAKKTRRKGREAYAGRDTCLLCHDTDHTRAQATTRHGRATITLEEEGRGWNCEGCHRPGKEHVEEIGAGVGIRTPILMTPRELGGACLQCHKDRFRWHEWIKCQHATGDVKCMECHDLTKDESPHLLVEEPAALCLGCHKETRGEFSLPSHHPVVTEERLACADCHDPHKRMPTNPREVTRLCRKCHVEQRGPYIYEHGAISGGLSEACLDCHRAHGSPNPELLRLQGRGLCLSCHADRIMHFAGAATCTACHTAMHGSNTSSLLFTP